MAKRVTVKYNCGEKVACNGVEGKVTAIFIRGKGRTYEFSYIDKDGNPTSCNTQECELEAYKPNSFGLKTK